MSLRSALESGKFVVTAEVGPPKGIELDEVLECARLLRGRVDGVNVTDLQSSILRLGSLATCHILKEQGLEPILQITCRDRNRLALQSDLLSAALLGIENVLVLTGDYPLLGDHPQAKPVFDLDSVQLLWVLRKMQEGYDAVGNRLQGKPSFFVGAVVNTGVDSEAALELQILKMEKKIDQGARFFQTQVIFDVKRFRRFMERVNGRRVPILAGIMLLKSARMARYMNENVPGVFVPEPIIKRMARTKDKVRTAIEIAAELVEEIRPYCQGIHIMSVGWERYIPDLLDALGVEPQLATVMVIDRDVHFLDFVSRALSSSRCSVVGITQSSEVLRRLQAQPADLIILGTLERPDEAPRLCRLLKAHPAFEDIPILVADVSRERLGGTGWRREDGLSMEADDYVVRPITEEELTERVRALLGWKGSALAI